MLPAVLLRSVARCLPPVARRSVGANFAWRELASRADIARMTPEAERAQFPAQYLALIDTLKKGLSAMASVNDAFQLTLDRTTSTLTLTVADECRFVLKSNASSGRAVLSMPATSFSGGGDMHYRFDTRTGQWVDEKDGHYLLEKLSRDLVARLKGYPEF